MQQIEKKIKRQLNKRYMRIAMMNQSHKAPACLRVGPKSPLI